MAGIMKAICMVLFAAALIAAVAPPSEAAIGCGQVTSYLGSCISYVTDQGPFGGCCDGVKGLYNAAQTTQNKQSVCNCLKSLASSYSGVNYGKAAGLPGQCDVSVPYKISPSTDCSGLRGAVNSTQDEMRICSGLCSSTLYK